MKNSTYLIILNSEELHLLATGTYPDVEEVVAEILRQAKIQGWEVPYEADSNNKI